MKNIILLTVMLLLVSSCGLFKKVVKTEKSRKVNRDGKIGLMSMEDSNNRQLKIEHLANRFSTGVGDLMQIEGEEIEIRPDGIVRIGKGSVKKKRINYIDSSSLFKRSVSVQRQQSAQKIQYKEEQLQFVENTSNRKERPAVTSLLYFLGGLLVLLFSVVWWFRRKV